MADKTIASEAFNRMKRDIITGALEPNMKLRLDDLQERYQVGVTPLREALSRLVAERLVYTEGQRGFWVSPISLTDLADVMRMRQMIEAAALRQAIERGDDRWEADLVGAFHHLAKYHRDCPEGGYDDAWEERHGAFHRALIAGCKSSWLLHLSGHFFDLNTRYRRLTMAKLQLPHRDHLDEHRKMMEAALARDADTACALISAHMSKTSFLLLEKNLQDGALGGNTEPLSPEDRHFLEQELARAKSAISLSTTKAAE
ncbi:FCD domain-containing protein [Telmatospirillum sp. J64-1]|uniref:FCD domain-containing protein n=1 Tax=Telmatospirillum sp. J64-1 TaxID=2502183 RepID=UPI00115F172E|nr:FCD domain-containing protein [Telmatospirillum sp. J64-1]